AVIVEEFSGGEVVEGGGDPAPLRLGGSPAERAARDLHPAARIFRAALGVDRERPAESVEPEGRIRAGNELHARDSRLRNEVPVHDVAERLVDASPVLEDRYALRRPQQR